MDEAEQREIIERLNNLAWYVRNGYPLELHEPESAGRARVRLHRLGIDDEGDAEATERPAGWMAPHVRSWPRRDVRTPGRRQSRRRHHEPELAATIPRAGGSMETLAVPLAGSSCPSASAR